MPSALTSEELEAFRTLVRDYHAAWSPGQKSFDISGAERSLTKFRSEETSARTSRFYSKGSNLTAYHVILRRAMAFPKTL